MNRILGIWMATVLTTALSWMPAVARAEGDNTKLRIKEAALGKLHAGAVLESLAVSPDSKRVAYGARRGDKALVVVDGTGGKEYDGVNTPLFTPDSRHVAYVAKRGGHWLVVMDGAEKEYDGVRAGSLLFSPDSSRVAYLAMRGDKPLVVVDEVRGREYKEYKEPGGVAEGSLMFSPDSKRVVYVAGHHNEEAEIAEK